MEGTPLSMALEHLRNGDTSISTFGPNPYPHKWSNTTRVDIFDVQDGKGYLYRNLDETEMRKRLKVRFAQTLDVELS